MQGHYTVFLSILRAFAFVRSLMSFTVDSTFHRLKTCHRAKFHSFPFLQSLHCTDNPLGTRFHPAPSGVRHALVPLWNILACGESLAALDCDTSRVALEVRQFITATPELYTNTALS